MRAFSIDLRQRVLADFEAGIGNDAVARKYRTLGRSAPPTTNRNGPDCSATRPDRPPTRAGGARGTTRASPTFARGSPSILHESVKNAFASALGSGEPSGRETRPFA